ncbi:MAG: CDP-glycerol glycerophosphotransferase family protein [Clostridia bacterium]|nr:CDP-glycerol glycerophosphotransferase family protein [Clostridia bacterium]
MRDTGYKSDVKRAALRAISVLFRRNRIVFESGPEFSCNTYPVYRYLVDEKHIDEKYELVWLVEDAGKYTQGVPERHRYLEYSHPDDPPLKKLIYLWTLATAKALVYSNRTIGKYSPSQYSICLMHGMPLKRTQDVYRIDDECDNVICTSPFFADNLVEGFGVSKSKLLDFDFPRNDYLFTERDAAAVLGFGGYCKTIVWLPTFRRCGFQSEYDLEASPTGLPLLSGMDELRRFDAFLKKENCLLLIKPHPAESGELSLEGLSNIRVVTDGELCSKGVQLNELLGRSDALITDYSTVYYDYLLTGKPIGLTNDDIEEYTHKRGFFYDDPYSVLKGARLSDANDLIRFIEDVKNGEDPYSEERKKICGVVHPYYKNNTAAAVGELILSRLR